MGKASRRDVNASKPPAEAPMPTIGNFFGGAFAEDFFEVFLILRPLDLLFLEIGLFTITHAAFL